MQKYGIFMSFRNEFERPKIVLRHFKVIFLAVLPTVQWAVGQLYGLIKLLL
ncbi:Uncharacterised protein [Sphingobacterium daejeonense]|nr:Uncharacterised protein [Sphingobacterium daejeonense]